MSFNKFDSSIYLKTISRVRLIDFQETTSAYPIANVEHLEEEVLEKSEVGKELIKSLLLQLNKVLTSFRPSETEAMKSLCQRFNIHYTEDLINYSGVVLSYLISSSKVQEAFEAETVLKKLQKLIQLLKEQVYIRVGYQELHDEATEKMTEYYEEVLHRKVLSIVMGKLGLEKDENTAIIHKYQKNLEGKTVPDHILRIYEEELGRFRSTDKQNFEFQVIKTYLDWLTCLPYGIYTEESLDLARAKEVLDRDHFGMKDVKDRIIELIAVSKLRGNSTGKIMCFVGPPGVGKTSIAKSIAEALNRKFQKITVGGLEDVRELKGHRRAYLGAMPGKIVQALKLANTENPVILIDEIDKVGRVSYSGNPENCLLEILDPQQNNSFSDHYMDVALDLSKVIFICTANYAGSISTPLKDRMELIPIHGYTAEEKTSILDNFLIPKAVAYIALHQHTTMYSLSEDAKQAMIKDYCREAGVRDLQKLTNKVLEKVAMKIVEGEESHITALNLKDYAGYPPYASERIYTDTPSGVAIGLPYTEAGSASLLVVEVTATTSINVDAPKTPLMTVTGSLKDVMKESVQIALSYARKLAKSLQNSYLDCTSLHVHIPAGGVTKEGSSAGIAITTALLSLALNMPVTPKLVMAGEISLNGKILGIEGLKEKIVVARREGITTVVLPEANRNSWDELTDNLKEGIETVFVTEYPEVFAVAFPSVKAIN